MGHPSETAIQRPSTLSTHQFFLRDATNKNGMQSNAGEGDSSGEYNIDRVTGFMMPRPRPRLPTPWDCWEDMLDAARQANLQVGDKIGLTPDEANASSAWRDTVCQVRTPYMA